MKAKDFDKKFDEGVEDVIGDLEADKTIRPNRPVQRVNVDLPTWMVRALDAEATRLGITRQSIIKVWLADRLDRMKAS